MTFNATIPNPSQSPGVFPAQNATNFARLKTIISGDHVFNDTAAANDGIHKQITLVNRTDPASIPVGGNGIQYTKNNGLSQPQEFFYNGITKLPVSPIKAFVNFNGTPGTPSIRGQYNVTGVSKTSTGLYRVTYTTAFASTGDYTVLVTTMDPSGTTIGNVALHNAFGTAATSSFVDVETFLRSNGSHVDCVYVGVVILSVA